MGFTEVGDQVWVARYPWFDVNVTLVRGARGLLIVDTHASAVAAREVIDDIRQLGAGQVVAAVNTHEHFDHTFGNGELRAAYGAMPIHAHQTAAANTIPAGERIKTAYAAEPDPRAAEVIATAIVPATSTFDTTMTLDLGDRLVELIHPGRGHTAGDLAVWIPSASVLLAGDLVEESSPPAFGADSYPLDWPQTLDVVQALIPPGCVVVPGHGAVVGTQFLAHQRAQLDAVASTIRELARSGVPLDQALSTGDWPYPADCLDHAVRRGYQQLTGQRDPGR
jgi:glyoxylase-like metal-dependent hydrolase (beta-lactamase superfamily II)